MLLSHPTEFIRGLSMTCSDPRSSRSLLPTSFGSSSICAGVCCSATSPPSHLPNGITVTWVTCFRPRTDRLACPWLSTGLSVGMPFAGRTGSHRSHRRRRSQLRTSAGTAAGTSAERQESWNSGGYLCGPAPPKHHSRAAPSRNQNGRRRGSRASPFSSRSRLLAYGEFGIRRSLLSGDPILGFVNVAETSGNILEQPSLFRLNIVLILVWCVGMTVVLAAFYVHSPPVRPDDHASRCRQPGTVRQSLGPWGGQTPRDPATVEWRQ
jgi:hypothetical protein